MKSLLRLCGALQIDHAMFSNLPSKLIGLKDLKRETAPQPRLIASRCISTPRRISTFIFGN